MEKKLQSFVTQHHDDLLAHLQLSDEPDQTYSRMLKLSEKVGDLAEAVLAQQAQEKTEDDASARARLGAEFADVVLATLLLSLHLDIDLQEELHNQLKKIKE